VPLHGLVRKRRGFEPLGWNVLYEFSDGNLHSALANMQVRHDHVQVPSPCVIAREMGIVRVKLQCMAVFLMLSWSAPFSTGDLSSFYWTTCDSI
jgi:hypothetical protein